MVNYILLVFFITIIWSFLFTTIHEIGHCLSILSISKIKKYKNVGLKLEFRNILSASTHCRYQLFTNKEIQIIALSGDLFATLSVLIPCTIIFKILIHELPILITLICSYIFLVFFATIKLIEWRKDDKQVNELTEDDRHDRYKYKYPEYFKTTYIYPFN